jgi:hypothetical protein
MKKAKITLALIPTALLLTIIGASAIPPPRTPGVIAGNIFTLDNFSFSWNSTDPSATPPAEWAGLNETTWLSITVENIVDTNVTCTLTAHYQNDTEETASGWIDVDSGDNLNMEMFIIAENLNPGDSIYRTGNFSSWNISETISWPYSEDSRDTNHINYTMEESSMPPLYIYVSANIYWDKATGVLTKMSLTMNQTYTYTTQYSISMELTESNMWVVPEFAELPQTLILLASVLALVTIARRRKLHNTHNS